MAKSTARQRLSNEINAGSMADIAFLLLIFFLVTTTIIEDKGIKVKLPPWTEDESSIDIISRNVFTVLVNMDDELLVRGKQIPLEALKDYAKEFIANPANNEEFAKSPKKAIISLQNDRETSYSAYLAVYNELRAAYKELWDDLSNHRYGKPYTDGMSLVMKKAIRAEIPLVISEAEPFDIASSD